MEIVFKNTCINDKITLGEVARLNNTSFHNTLINIGKNLNKVYIKNNKLSTLKDDDESRIRRQDIGFVFQFHHLRGLNLFVNQE